MKNLFETCKTFDEAKTLFRTLSKKMHPDLGGSHEEFLNLMTQFENFKPVFNSENEFANKEFDKEKFAEIIDLLKDLDNVQITFAGTFIWVEGDTYSQREKIKALNLPNYKNARFAGKKKAWYFAPIDYVKKSRKDYGLDEIKKMFGAETYTQKKILIA